MENENRKPAARDRWGEWVTVVVLFLAGLALYFIAQKVPNPWQSILSSIGLSFLGISFSTGIILAVVGSSVGGLRKAIGNLHTIIDKEIDTIHQSVDNLSTLSSNAYSLGIVGVGRSRRSANFEGGKNFVERWKYLLEHANEVDLICFADRILFNSDVFDPFFIEKIKHRMKPNPENHLKLRIILTSLDNPHNDEITKWKPSSSSYIESRIHDAKDILKNLCGDELRSDVVREHKSFVPFTLLRGDDYMYVMYFIPGRDGGPVLEIRPSESIAYSRTAIDRAEDDQKLFQIYKLYFQDMWDNKTRPIIPPTKSTP